MPATVAPPSSPTLSDEQAVAVDRAVAHIRKGEDSEFKIGGYAGVGKTTILRSILDRLDSSAIAVAALAGKAVEVLRRKGVRRAQTIHKTIYEFNPDDRKFYLKHKKALGFDAFIIDEASMVSKQLYTDLRSFGRPIVWVGDMGQLEPVGEDVNVMDERTLDVKLETIHRQAEGNAILDFATAVRKGEPFGYCQWGEVTIAPPAEFWKNLTWADQVICGTNRTRHAVNARMRSMAGHGDKKLVEGEKIIVLQNNRDYCVFNGMSLRVAKIHKDDGWDITCDCTTEDGETLYKLPLLRDQFGKDKDPQAKFRQGSVLADYGGCITTHKAQGSQWGKVLVFEDCDAWDMKRWRYTAASRPSDELMYCKRFI